MEEKTVLSIDASLTGFAMALKVPGKDVELFEYSTKPTKTLRARVKRIRSLVYKVIDLLTEHKPDLIIIEGYSYASKGSSSITLGELGGVLRHSIVDHVLVIEVPPSTLKKFATDKGNAGKTAVATALTHRYGIPFSSDNKADAFGLLQIGLCALDCVKPATKKQKEVVDLVKQIIQREGE